MAKKEKKDYEKFFAIFGKICFIILIIVFLIYIFQWKSLGEINLERKYEVLDYRCPSEQDYSGSVKMLSFGDREEQIFAGLIAIVSDCPERKNYSINIIEENKDCNYFINGELARSYLDSNYIVNETKIRNSADFQLWLSIVLKQMNEASSNSNTEGEFLSYLIGTPLGEYYYMDENGMSWSTYHSIITTNIEWKTENCD